jgi:hypothetical protein
MKLPKIEHPIFTTKLPSTGKLIKFRPFLVKEEKILLMALAGEDENEMNLAAKQIVNNCVIDELDVETAPIFDIEWLFLQIRIKSVGTDCKITFSGDENSECDGCKKAITKEINLEEIKCEKGEGHNKKIHLNDKIGVVMKYPTPEILSSPSENYVDLLYQYIVGCIDIIFDDKESHNVSDFKKEEVESFIDSLNRDQLAKIEHFFKSSPECRLDVDLSCEKCGKKQIYTLTGLTDFFA